MNVADGIGAFFTGTELTCPPLNCG